MKHIHYLLLSYNLTRWDIFFVNKAHHCGYKMTDYASFLFVKPVAAQLFKKFPYILLIPTFQYCIIHKNLP